MELTGNIAEGADKITRLDTENASLKTQMAHLLEEWNKLTSDRAATACALSEITSERDILAGKGRTLDHAVYDVESKVIEPETKHAQLLQEGHEVMNTKNTLQCQVTSLHEEVRRGHVVQVA